MIIVVTSDKDLSHGKERSVTKKVYTSSVKLSSTLFSCSVGLMYNRAYCYQKQCLVLK